MRKCLWSRIGALSCVLVLAGVVGTACGAPGGASTKAKASKKQPIRIGMMTSLTGVAAANFKGAEQGVQAAFDAQNAKGGVDGHKLDLIVKDDQTSPQAASTAVSELIGPEHVFSLIFISPLAFLAYKPTVTAHVPVVGAAVDGPEWGQRPNTNMVAVEGDHAPALPPNTIDGKVAKLEGAKSFGALGVNGIQSSTAAAQDAITGAKALGLKTPYYNDSSTLGSVNVTTLVLGMKQAGIDSYFSALLETSDFALMSKARQSGLQLKAAINASGYSQTLLTTATALRSAQGGIFSVTQVPPSEHTAATKAEMAAFKKYEHFTGVPNLNWTFGWLSGKLTIAGLEKIKGKATRTAFLGALRKMTHFTGTGLLPQPSNLSLADFGKTPTKTQCGYFVKLKGKKFVPINGGKPVCGTNVGS